MQVGDKYKVYLEVAPGLFEPVGEAAIKRINKEDNKVDLVIPATLVVMDTKVELDPTPQQRPDTGNSHVMLGTEDANGVVNNSGATPSPSAINSTPEATTEAPESAVQGEAQPAPTPIVPAPATNVEIDHSSPVHSEPVPVSDPSSPPVES